MQCTRNWVVSAALIAACTATGIAVAQSAPSGSTTTREAVRLESFDIQLGNVLRTARPDGGLSLSIAVVDAERDVFRRLAVTPRITATDPADLLQTAPIQLIEAQTRPDGVRIIRIEGGPAWTQVRRITVTLDWPRGTTQRTYDLGEPPSLAPGLTLKTEPSALLQQPAPIENRSIVWDQQSEQDSVPIVISPPVVVSPVAAAPVIASQAPINDQPSLPVANEVLPLPRTIELSPPLPILDNPKTETKAALPIEPKVAETKELDLRSKPTSLTQTSAPSRPISQKSSNKLDQVILSRSSGNQTESFGLGQSGAAGNTSSKPTPKELKYAKGMAVDELNQRADALGLQVKKLSQLLELKTKLIEDKTAELAKLGKGDLVPTLNLPVAPTVVPESPVGTPIATATAAPRLVNQGQVAPASTWKSRVVAWLPWFIAVVIALLIWMLFRKGLRRG